ncbi:hypothetical protein H6P1_00520 (plasmid) [Variovorax sp. PBL-H6]|nr:hypothetical protein SRS16P1_00386 [Variovorax sp. SRS16]VTU42927.1 hypothetical protein E5P1_00384 [Variovorax sp. PBL-E5]VTU43601.1 hypothetical protein H6P1_00520 [Variovorax sp. PBL-H6]
MATWETMSGMTILPLLRSLEAIERASRPELVGYLEAWGFQTYDHESDEVLRAAARQNFETEGDRAPGE